MFDEEAPAPIEGQAESTASEEKRGMALAVGEDAGRRGGRRGRGNQRNESAPETQTAPPEEPAEPRPEPRHESRYESRPRQDYAPPAGYQPIILPGESISKYRNLSQPAAETQAEVEATISAG